MNTRTQRCRAGFIAALAFALMVACASKAEAQEGFRPMWIDGSSQYDTLGGFGARLVCASGSADEPLFLLSIREFGANGCSFDDVTDVPVMPPTIVPPVSPPTLPPIAPPVPEPEVWTLMMAGLAALAWKRGRRTNRRAPASAAEQEFREGAPSLYGDCARRKA